MSDFLAEQVLTIAEAVKVLPTRPSVHTLWRWSQKGLRGVRLETWLIGGRRVTSVEAVQRFISATSDAGERAVAETTALREAALRAAEEDLDREGA